MLKQIAEGVFVHESGFLKSNTTVIQGTKGVLLIDPGITSEEMAEIAGDLKELGQSVVAAFSTHPDWDHVLWHAAFGDVPRYGTEANAASMRDLVSQPNLKDRLADALPPEIIDEIPVDDLFGKITGLPVGTAYIPWEGPKIKIIEHEAHAHGHAALLIEERGVLVAGDMLSDILVPFPNLETPDPVGDYLASLKLFEDIMSGISVMIPGHGSVGNRSDMQERIALDRVYVQALHDGTDISDDPRLSRGPNKDWLPGVYQWQAQQMSEKYGTIK